MRNVIYILIAVLCLNIGALMVLAFHNYYFIPLLVIGAFFLMLTFLVSNKNHDLGDLDEDPGILAEQRD